MRGQEGAYASSRPTASPSTATPWRERSARGPSSSSWARRATVAQALEAIGDSRPDVAIIGGTLDGLSGEQLLNAVARDGLAHARA